jgi:hypothetical protein
VKLTRCLFLVVVLLAWKGSFAQESMARPSATPEPPSKAEIKAAKKAEKERLKTERRDAEAQRRGMTVDFEQLTTFPASFVGPMQRRLYRVGIGNVQPYTESGTTYYPVELTNGSKSTLNVPVSDQVTFVLSESIAREFISKKQDDLYLRSRIPVVDVYFELGKSEAQGRPYYVAKVTCLALLDGYSNAVRTPIGDCPLVK